MLRYIGNGFCDKCHKYILHGWKIKTEEGYTFLCPNCLVTQGILKGIRGNWKFLINIIKIVWGKEKLKELEKEIEQAIK